MPIKRYPRHYTEKCPLREPDAYFVFGDNAERTGKGGAAVIRDCPNAIGIVTKWRPNRHPRSYFSDREYQQCVDLISQGLNTVEQLLKRQKLVYFPQHIGNGLAALPTKAPLVWAYLCDESDRLFDTYGQKEVDRTVLF